MTALVDEALCAFSCQQEESFSVVVCSPDWLAQEAGDRGIVDGRHTYVVNTWDWPAIRLYFENRVREYSAGDWHTLALLLSRIGAWEFEDYREYVEN